MNIGIRTDREDFFYDLHSLVKSFFPDDDVEIYSENDAARCSKKRDLEIVVEIPESASRKETKDALKKDVYETLKNYTGRELPWGMLSGIRPTKIPMQMLFEGASEEECVRHLMEADFVSEKKARLASEIAVRERELLEHVPHGPKDYSLYVHVPFCPSICLYCTFSSSPIGKWSGRADEYLLAVRREMLERKKRMQEEGFEGGPRTIYIGGGTPTSLEAEQLERLLTDIREIWDLSDTLEFTVEAGRPDSFSTDRLRVLKNQGVTRISVNPQTMNDSTLALIGRKHTSADTVRAFHMAREVGFDNINMDIILGLPGEGEAEVARTLEAVSCLHPESLTVHSLAVKRASALTLKIREDRESDENADRGSFRGYSLENSERIMDMAAESAAGMGMHPYYLYRQKNMRGNLENTGFAVPGAECLYNILIMEELQSIAAFGAAASTKRVYEDGRIERSISPKDVKTYLERSRISLSGN